MAEVTILAQDEAVRLDAEKLEALYRQLGDVSAEDIVCRAMEELAVKLAQVERHYREGRAGEMRKTARMIVAIAEQIGMQMLARVAGDAVRCLDHRDEIALAAVLARLIRTGERSLTEVWELQDLSI
ncbi:hypothetical protein [Marimonas arenosa]|uniref:Uncharacterized protein n=1 Tax=Marimonas arenosa TaxID=1795305 RepID=A0AAE3WBG7_9RHOB|nr:hypothetical protein [Marimonas arenosa]MDQ2089634.1 hypothetical protein [Marimonas arenosa]